MIEITGTIQCISCDEKYDIDIYTPLCDECIEEKENNTLGCAIEECLEKDYLWKDESIYEGFWTNDQEKSAFFKGVKMGYFDALFWMAEYYDCVGKYEALKKEYDEKEKKNDRMD